MENKAKMTAIAAAVMNYIKTEEEAAIALSAMSSAPVVEQVQTQQMPPVQVNMWGMSGRQSQMQMRNMMQMKAFHGA
ncbi:hypothetical protein QUF76_00215 [Desulfobacterales bacterium HSG16]|nr:hypothetical protein [Desulfobacterales bacterium HSG16]